MAIRPPLSVRWRLFPWRASPPSLCLWRAPIPGTHSRLLLASDGLWDVISHAQACKLMRNAATAQRAADLLLSTAERISNEKRGRTVETITWSHTSPPIHQPPKWPPSLRPPPRHVLAWARLCSPAY